MFDFGFSLEEIQQLGLLILLGITGINTIMLIDIYLHQLPAKQKEEKKIEDKVIKTIINYKEPEPEPKESTKYDNENNPIF